MAEQTIEADIAAVAALIGDPTRAAMLTALADTDALSVSQLAARSKVGLSTASEHLGRLENVGLVRSARRGRGRFVSMAGPEVATALEALAVIAPSVPVRSLRQSVVASRLASARTCYDHLAGKLGVALMEDLLRRRVLQPDTAQRYEVTRRGDRSLQDIGIDASALRGGKRILARACLDWTEKQPHLGGAVGAAICQATLERRWITRQDRVVEITPAGADGLIEWLGRRSKVASFLATRGDLVTVEARRPGERSVTWTIGWRG
jgi:DNA-binding transcriptional ArsR family regulator